MYTAKICLNSVPGDPINFILGGLTPVRPPTSGEENSCYGDNCCLAMGPQNLHFMMEYFINANVYKLQNRHITSSLGPGHDPILV